VIKALNLGNSIDHSLLYLDVGLSGDSVTSNVSARSLVDTLANVSTSKLADTFEITGQLISRHRGKAADVQVQLGSSVVTKHRS